MFLLIAAAVCGVNVKLNILGEVAVELSCHNFYMLPIYIFTSDVCPCSSLELL